MLTLLFVPTLSYSEQKPYKFFKNEILFGLAKKQLRNDTRSISSKKALSIYEDSDGKALKITLDQNLKVTKMIGIEQVKEIKDGKLPTKENR